MAMNRDVLRPSLRTRRTSSLNRALASCNSQWLGCRARTARDADDPGDAETYFLVMLTRIETRVSGKRLFYTMESEASDTHEQHVKSSCGGVLFLG